MLLLGYMLFYMASFVFLVTSLLFRKFLFYLKYILPASEILLLISSSVIPLLLMWDPRYMYNSFVLRLVLLHGFITMVLVLILLILMFLISISLFHILRLCFKSSSDFRSKTRPSAKASCEILTGFSCQFPKSKDFESPVTVSSIKIMNVCGLRIQPCQTPTVA